MFRSDRANRRRLKRVIRLWLLLHMSTVRTQALSFGESLWEALGQVCHTVNAYSTRATGLAMAFLSFYRAAGGVKTI